VRRSTETAEVATSKRTPAAIAVRLLIGAARFAMRWQSSLLPGKGNGQVTENDGVPARQTGLQ